jgi:DNA-binding beta-propeller fold protein YncE
VSRIDPDADEVVATMSVGAGPVEIAVSPDAVWVTNSLDRRVSRLEP